MLSIWCQRIIGVLLVATLSGLPALAAAEGEVDSETLAKNRKANEVCFACHSAAGIAKPPQASLDMSKLNDSRVEPNVFNKADHGVMDCRQCHSSKHYSAEYPHGEAGKTETSPCNECHAAKQLRLEPQFNASVHAKVEGVKEKFTCNT